MMKKFLAILLVLTMTFSLAACGGNSNASTGSDAPATKGEKKGY